MDADAVAWLQLQTGDEVQFVGVTSHDDFDEVVQIAAKVRIDSFPQILDRSGEVLAHFGVSSHPALVLIAADGSVERSYGSVDPMAMLERVEQLAVDL